MIPKFRAWDKVEKEWLSIRTIGFDDDGSVWYLQAWDDNENDIDPPYFEDDLGVKWELLQSTGLKDKNGVEIFEGDVVNREKGLGIPHEIIFKNCEFKLVTPHSEESLGKTRKGGLIIVGNKYEHPHLLKE